MAQSNFTPSDSNTPWWYETPSLASQSIYSQSTFAGASISQLSDPFSISTERFPHNEGSQIGEDDSDEEGQRNFLITTVDTDTGQSSIELSTDLDNALRYRNKPLTIGHTFHSNTGSAATLQNRMRTSESYNKPRMSSSLPKSTRFLQSADNDMGKDKKQDSSGSNVSSLTRDQSTGLRESGKNKQYNKQKNKPISEAGISPTSSNGVVNFTVNCQIHLHSENGELKRSNSNIELLPSTGSQLPIMLPGTISMTTATGINPGLVVNEERDSRDMTLHSTITEEESTDLSGLLNQDTDNPTGMGDTELALSPVSLSSQESQLSHSMSSANQEILNYLLPQLMQYLNPVIILPLLNQHNLLSSEDIRYISHPFRTDKEKKKRILSSAPACDFDLFVDCISSERTDSGHVYLARRIKEAVERKRNNPFKRLSSLRGHQRDPSKPSPLSLKRERKHSPHSSATPSPKTPTRGTSKSLAFSIPSKQSASNVNTREDDELILGDFAMKSKGKDTYNHNTSTLPRRFESNLKHDSRGTKPYSSARFSSMNSPSKEKRSKLSRHGSFQGSSDGRVKVTPLLKDFSKLSISQENSDVLENLSHFKTSVFQFPSTSQEFSYQNMMESSQVGYSSSSQSRFDNTLRDSQKRGKKSMDPSLYTTIPEVVSESVESQDAIPPPMPVKQRHSAKKQNNSTKLNNSRLAPTSTAQNEGGASRQPSQAISQEPTQPVMVFSVDRPRHSSPRRENSKQAVALKRGTSLYGVSDSPSSRYPLTKYEGTTYMPSALSPEPSNSASSTGEKPPPVPIKQRTHRRTQSYDTSQTSTQDFITFPTPHQPRPSTYKHFSLRHDTPSSRTGTQSASSTFFAVPSHIPIISTQDSGITSSFDGKLRSPSGYSLSTDPGSSVSKYLPGATASDAGSELVIVKKFEWLQERVRFKTTPEDVLFTSRTHFNQERMILNSGILYENGRPKFLVLLTDMLLILKPRKKANVIPGKLGAFFSSSQGPVLDWFSDLDCVAKMPLMLHHLSVRSLSKRKEPQVLYLHYDNQSEMIQFTLHSVSKEAKDIWVESLNSAIIACTRAQARIVLPEGNIIHELPTSPTYTKLTLTIVEGNNVAVEVDAKTRNHFCSVQLGERRCKTPSVKAQCWPTWNYKFEFVDFSLTETVWIEFYTERITSPDEYLGGVDIQLMAVAQRLKVNMSQGVSTLQLKNQHLPLKNGKGTLTLHFELGWVTSSSIDTS